MVNKYKIGRLCFNQVNEQYGLKVGDAWVSPGFSCGDCLEVFVDGEWCATRMEMEWSGIWYLVETPYRENLENVSARIKVWCD